MTFAHNSVRILGVTFANICIIFGSLVAMVGLIKMIQAAVFVSGATKISGQIIAIHRSDSTSHTSLPYPVFTFTDHAGVVHHQRSAIGSSYCSYKAGDPVIILFDSSDPQRAEIGNFTAIWLVPLFLTGFGLLFIGFFRFWVSGWARGNSFQRPKVVL